MELTAPQLDAYLQKQKEAGLRPLSIAGYTTPEGIPQFAAIFEPNKEKWEWTVAYGLTTAGLQQKARELAPKGLRPLCITAYPHEDTVRYCTVWITEPQKPTPYPKEPTIVKHAGYELLVNATQRQMQQWLEARKKDKHSVLWLDVVAVAEQPLYSAIAALDDRQTDWGAVLDFDCNEYNIGKAIDKLFNHRRYEVHIISGYPAQDSIRCALLWAPIIRNRPWSQLPDITPADFAKELQETKDAGYVIDILRPYAIANKAYRIAVIMSTKPREHSDHVLGVASEELDKFIAQARQDNLRVTQVTEFVQNDRLVFAAVARSNTDKVLWEISRGLSALALQAESVEWAKKGYRPATITACPFNGTVRYSVVWVKETTAAKSPKKAKEEK
ncbi:MAG: hypothetical protein RMJ56_13560 [Gemmataceae bacterium]|nr:hypothetical protein [Gemmata sp.]MDW8198620.1 hypothetical protein [Gemmataceae bacterium]